MSYEELPNEFDIVLLGTGLVTTITAAAFSRIGLKVLHLDRNDFYGGPFANFNLEAIETWKKRNQELCGGSVETNIRKDEKETASGDEICISLPRVKPQAFNLTSSFHVRERTAEEEEVSQKARIPIKPFLPFCPAKVDEAVKIEDDDNDNECSQDDQSGASTQVEEKSEDNENSSETTKPTSKNLSHEQGSNSEENKEMEGEMNSSEASDELSAVPEPEKCDKGDEEGMTGKQIIQEEKKKEWTAGDIRDEWRRFCFDLSPRVMYCCGDIIELLIKSDVARYCEFRTVSRVLTLLKDKLEPVPCSRADVFASKIVSLIEKRLMMKFLQFAADFENHPEEYEDHKNGTFKDFLKSKKLTPNLQHFVQHAIAMVDDSCSTEDGLTKTKKFLTSLGRYGNTAFLFPLYGSGELSQAFSRMSAVFGGVYCLMETATHILADTEANCCGIITSKGQKISCKYLIAESSYLPSNYVQRLSQGKISRAIFITDTSIEPSSDEDLTLLNFICKEDQSRPVTVLEIPSSACVCPRNLYVVYLTRKSDSDDPKEDLREVQDRLLASIDGASSNEESRPHILWSMYFTMEDWSEVSMTEEALGRVMVSSEGGDAGIDLDKCVPEAKQLFHSVCPDEEFLPTPPNPEDIIHVDDTESAVVSGAAGDFEQGNEDPEDSQQTGPDSSEVVNEESKCEEKDSEASNDKVEQ